MQPDLLKSKSDMIIKRQQAQTWKWSKPEMTQTQNHSNLKLSKPGRLEPEMTWTQNKLNKQPGMIWTWDDQIQKTRLENSNYLNPKWLEPEMAWSQNSLILQQMKPQMIWTWNNSKI